MDDFWNAVWSVSPTIILGVAFFLVIRSIFAADRKERDAYMAIENEERAKRAAMREAAAE